MMKRSVGSMMGVVVLGLLSSGCGFLQGPPLTALGPNWNGALNGDLRVGAARAQAAIASQGVNARLLWVGSHDASMGVVRGPTGLPIGQEAQAVAAVEYPATHHCYWMTGKIGRANNGPPMVQVFVGPHEPNSGSLQGPLVCDAVNSVQGGVRAPFN
jgi:hypothetical protein